MDSAAPYPVLGIEVGGGTLLPLMLRYESCAVKEEVVANITATFERGYSSIIPLLSEDPIGECSIVGSAPSIEQAWPHLKGTVFACNAAHDFLISKGVIPTYGMFWDADKVVSTMFTPHESVTYLVASRCHPSVFEKLRGYKVVVWHPYAEEDPISEMLKEYGVDEPTICGGSAGVTRCAYLAAAMGYHTQHWFGCDSSYSDGKSHYRPSAVHEELFRVCCDHEWFDTTRWLCGQIEDFKIIGPLMRALGADITINGRGLLPKVAKNLGFKVNFF